MKMFDDDIPLDVPLVPDVAAVVGDDDDIVVVGPHLQQRNKEQNNKPWHDYLCSSSACEWIAATSL